MNTALWPEIIDLQTALRLTRQGFWAALLIGVADLLIGAFNLTGEPVAGTDGLIILDGALFGVIAIGLWMRLRSAAVVGLLFFIAETVVQGLSLAGPWNPVLAACALLAFVSAVRGTFVYRTQLREPIRASVYRTSQGSFALLMFSVVRKMRAVRRKLFGKSVPHWATDLSGSFLSRLNVLQLLPTIWAIFFFPAHFFYRTPQIIEHSSLYRTPIRFGLNVFILAVANYVFLYKYIGITHLNAMVVAAFCLSLPLTLPVIGLVFWCIAAPFRYVLQPSGWYINSAHYLTLIDPSTYRNIRWSPRCWGLVYYFGYSLTVPQLAFLVSVGIVYVAFARSGVSAGDHNYAPYLLLGIVLVLDRVFIIPYCELLRGLADYPTKRMLRSDIQPLASALRNCASVLDRHATVRGSLFAARERKQIRLYKRATLLLEGSIRSEWFTLQRRLQQDRRIELVLPTEMLARFQNERASVYSEKAFGGFADAWEASALRGDKRFAYIEDLLETVRAIAGRHVS